MGGGWLPLMFMPVVAAAAAASPTVAPHFAQEEGAGKEDIR